MSKSLGNFITLENVVERGFLPLAVRYLFLQTHYRQETNFTWEALKAANTALQQLYSQVAIIRRQSEAGERSELSEEKLDKLNEYRKKFKDVVRFDLNTPQAVAVVWEIIKTNIPPGDKYDLLMIADEILGLGLGSVTSSDTVSPPPDAKVQDLINRRDQARQNKDFAASDRLRDEIAALGYTVMDTPQGTSVKKKLP